MTQKDLILKMDATEIVEWMAYDQLKDDKYRAGMIEKATLEEQEGQSAQQEAALVRDMFKQLGILGKKGK